MSIHLRVAAFLMLLQVATPWAADTKDLGAQIAQQGTPNGVVPCMTCHGPDGGGMAAAGYPRLAGLNPGYLSRELQAFRSGQRNNPVMLPMAKGLTEDEIAAVSVYYAKLPVPATPAPLPDAAASPALSANALAHAEGLARWGDWTGRGLPACAQCHGPEGNGIGAFFPGIAGQPARYIAAQLVAWRSGTRTSDPLA